MVLTPWSRGSQSDASLNKKGPSGPFSRSATHGSFPRTEANEFANDDGLAFHDE